MSLDILLIADIVGTIAFALSGLFIAARNNLDMLGLFIISFLTALGGGVIRDIIINKVPSSFSNSTPALIVIAIIAVGLLFKLHKKSELENHFLFILFDTLGLVSFAITGALLAIKIDLQLIGVVFLALITAVGGGVLRDMLLNKVPLLLKSDFYGSVALLVGAMIYLLHTLDMTTSFNILIVFAIGVSIRFIAYYRNWHLPKL